MRVSDVYAMGGRPITALAIAAFPAKDFAADIVKAIFAGGLSVLQECGVALLGGHTVQDLGGEVRLRGDRARRSCCGVDQRRRPRRRRAAS